MSRFARYRRLGALPALCLMPLLSGCLAVAAVGTGASVGYVASEDRTVKENFDDTVFCGQINALWTQFNSQLNDNLDCHSYQGRVLVTGEVPSEDWRDEAINRAKQVSGVKEVYDEITIGPGNGFTGNAHDIYVTQHLKAELLTAGDVHSTNYIVTTANGVVYIIGTARDEAELNRVVDYGRNMDGVKRVVSYIRIRANANLASGTGANDSGASQDQPAPGDTMPSEPTPRNDIQVTPLDTPPAPSAPNTAPAAPPPGNNNGVTPLR